MQSLRSKRRFRSSAVSRPSLPNFDVRSDLGAEVLAAFPLDSLESLEPLELEAEVDAEADGISGALDVDGAEGFACLLISDLRSQ